MIETTTTADALGPMPGERRKRRATERPYQREAFQLYPKLRNIKRVADAIGASEKVVQAWSARFHWVARAAAYDLRQDEIQAEEQDRQTREHTALWVKEQFVQRKRNLKSGRAMQDKGDRKLNLPDTERLIKTENGATVFRPRSDKDPMELIVKGAKLCNETIKDALAATPTTVQEIEEFELEPLGKKDDNPQT
jgi:hypothetical protein